MLDTSSIELTNEKFETWWKCLAQEDRDEFYHIYDGDTYLARFVCALDLYLLHRPKEVVLSFDDICTVAYAIAAKEFEKNIDVNSVSTRNRALRAWKHDAVQALYDRVRYRNVRQGSIRLQNKLFDLANSMADKALLESADPEMQKNTANVLIQITKLVNAEEQFVRSQRTQRGLEKARQSLMGEGAKELDDRVFKALLGAGAEKFGKDEVMKMLNE